MQSEILMILKTKYECGDLGWYSNRQIFHMCIELGFDINLSTVIVATGKLYQSQFLNCIKNKGGQGYLFRYRNRLTVLRGV